jgi:CHAD domain-containing protein
MTLLEKQMRGLTADLSGTISKLTAGELTPKNVHRLRTNVRRIESLVSYAHPDLDKKLERSLEKMADLRKRAGKVRDLDVQVKLLDSIGNGSTEKDRKTLTALLDKKRNRQAKRLAAGVKKVQESKFFARMHRIAERAGETPGNVNRPLAPLEEARAQLAEMAKEFPSNRTIKLGRLHEARISLKRIRYLAELAEESAEQKSFIRDLKTVQDAIGDWHDWQELTRTAEKRFSDRVNCALLREVRALLGARHSEATSAINKLIALPSGYFSSKKRPRSTSNSRALAQSA